MTTLTDKQIAGLAEQPTAYAIRNHQVVATINALKAEIAELQKDLAFLNSRPSPGVQAISGGTDNAGQAEGSAQAALSRISPEDIARIVYDAMPYTGAGDKPRWIAGGNSLMQDVARTTALNIIAHFTPDVASTPTWRKGMKDRRDPPYPDNSSHGDVQIGHVATLIARGTSMDPGAERKTPLEIANQVCRYLRETAPSQAAALTEEERSHVEAAREVTKSPGYESDYDIEALLAIIDRLTQQGAAQREGWMPIETAPKDGTHIDLWYPHGIGREPDSYWHEILQAWCREEDTDDGAGAYVTRGRKPTHWMPLPAAPAAQEGEK